MNYVDTHNHQAGWSVDAAISFADLIAEARSLGLKGVTLSDHFDYDGSPDNAWCLDPDDYEREMAKKRRTDEGDLMILSGIELGYTRAHEAHIAEVASAYDFDHVILSLHYFNGVDPFLEPAAAAAGYDNHAAFVAAVIDEIAYSAARVPVANTIGHYDFCSRYVRWQESKFCYRDAPESFDRLFRIMIANGQSLELNGGTVSRLQAKGYALEDALPDHEILARYKDLGGSLVTLASDAHKPGRLGQHSDMLLRQLEEMALKPCCFIKKKVQFL